MTEEKKNELIIKKEDYGNSIVEFTDLDSAKNMIQAIIKHDIVRPEDKQFFMENTERWNDVSAKTHIWRTKVEKDSILYSHPTLHAKFHQAILENKVFYEQTLQLDKDAKMTKLEAEELYIDVENLKEEIAELQEDLESGLKEPKEERQINYRIRKKDVELRKKLTELHEKAIAVKNQENAMLYRIDELKDWKNTEDKLIEEMKNLGYTDEQIWDKNFGQREAYFLLFLTKYQGVKQSKDSGEIHNLTYLARFAVEEAAKDGLFEDYLKRCDRTQINSLAELGYVKIKPQLNEQGEQISLIPDQIKKKQ